MTRRNDPSPVGCAAIGLMMLVGIVVALVGLAASIPVAPAVVLHLYRHDPAALATEAQLWLVLATALPFVAPALVHVASPRNGRLRGLRRTEARPYDGSPPPPRRAVVWGYIVRAGIIAAAPNAFAFGMLEQSAVGDGPAPAELIASAVGYGVLVVLLVLAGILLLDSRPSRVTAETVRAATSDARRLLRQARADDRRVERLVRQVEARLRAAPAEADFHMLRNLHFESFRCADVVYGNYTSTRTSLRLLSRVAASARRQARAMIAQLHWGPSWKLTRRALHDQVELGLRRVQHLNARTADLKHKIRDDCGVRGGCWYDDLMQRIDERTGARRAAGV
jgi:hypothetical protein